MKDKISNLKDFKKILEKEQVKVFGIGGLSYTRSEVWALVPDFELICANKTGELASIEEKVKIKVFDLSDGEKEMIKKPEKILESSKVQEYIKESSKDKKVGIITQKPSRKMHQICRDHGWTLMANSFELYEKFERESEFEKILNELNLRRKTKKYKIERLDGSREELFHRFGNKIVIQLISDLISGGGKGIIFVKKDDPEGLSEKVWRRLKELKLEKTDIGKEIIVSKFFEGPSLSISGCVTQDNEVLTTYAQFQLIDIPEVVSAKKDARGVFCGHDWILSNKIPRKIQKKAIQLADGVGRTLKKEGYLGYFGIDFIWEKETDEIVLLELNPRLVGTFPLAVQVQLQKKEVPLVCFHMADFLRIDYWIKKKSVYQKGKKRKGAHLIIFNPYAEKVVFGKDMKGGVYRLDNKKEVEFLRNGFELEDIREKGEFIVTDGVPLKELSFGKNRKILKLVMKEQISTNGFELNNWAKKVVQGILKEIDGKIKK